MSLENEKIEIRPFSIADRKYFDEAQKLLNRTQGEDLFPPHYIERKLNDPLALVIGAFIGQEVISVGVAQVLHDLKYYIVFDENIEEKLKNNVVGSFSTLCVREDYQGKGLGQRMSHVRLNWLKDKGCEVILGISWVSGKEHNSSRVFEKLGFGMVKLVDNFFYESSLQNPFNCPACGSPPCTCAAMLYRLNLDQ